VSVANWDVPLTAEERETLIVKVVEAVNRRGLTVPTVFALEMHRPLGFMASQGAVVLAPMLAPLLGIDRLQAFSKLLADRTAVDEIILRLEADRSQ
jgi:hypothetical protein